MHVLRFTAHHDRLDQGWLLVDAPTDMREAVTPWGILWDVCPSTAEVTSACTAALRGAYTEAASAADSCRCILLRHVRYVRNTVRSRVRSRFA